VNAAEKIVAALAQPYPLEKGEALLGASVGAAVYPTHGDAPDVLQKAADAALYQAKREGKNRVRTAAALEAPAALTEMES